MVDVETERKAPAPGLKEKDEEEKSGIGTEEKEERSGETGAVCSKLQSQWARNLWVLPTEPPRGRERKLEKSHKLK